MTVLTSPKRREYFAATMASIRHAGGDKFRGDKVVFIDGTNVLTESDWKWYQDTAGLDWQLRSTDEHGDAIGTKPSMLSILHAARGATRLIYLEDDVALCKNAILFSARVHIPGHLAFISLCDIKNVAPLPGFTECPGYDYEAPTGEGGHWGNQMLIIPGSSLAYLHSSVSLPDWDLSTKASDIMLGISLATGPAPWKEFGVFSPSLAQHVGDRSLVNPLATVHGWGRDSLTWPGANFDALTLLNSIPHKSMQKVIPFYKADTKTRRMVRFRGNGSNNKVAA